MLSTAHRRRLPLRRAPASAGPWRIAVLMGGIGSEREVSLVSGSEVARALSERGHAVTEVVLDSSDDSALDAIPEDTECVFLALHGEYGEDGTIQQSLARRGLCYTGSGPEASARAFDKIRAKRLFARAGLPLAEQRVLRFPFDRRSVRHTMRMLESGTYVVKPARAGSSVGISICTTRGELEEALWAGAAHRQDLLVERFVPGHELTCGVLGRDALPVVEAIPQNGFYDYQAKYDKAQGTTYAVDPEHLPLHLRQAIQEMALMAHEVLGCDDFSRTDFRYDPKRDELVVLETNTIPGLTPTSLLPKGAAARGIDFGMLVERICRLSLNMAVR